MVALERDADLRIRLHELRVALRGARPHGRRVSACPDCGADEGEAAVLGVRGARRQPRSPASAAASGGGGCCGGGCGCGTETRADARRRSRPTPRVAGCTRCALAATRTQVVFGSGSPTAELMFVGEAPGLPRGQAGRPVRRRRRPAARQAARRASGSSREDVYIANVLKCRPPRQPRSASRGDRGLREPPLPPDRADPARRSSRRSATSRPSCSPGKPDGITRVHGAGAGGRRSAARAVLLYPIFHPAAALYTPRMLEVLEADFARLPDAARARARRRVDAAPPAARAARRPEPAVAARAVLSLAASQPRRLSWRHGRVRRRRPRPRPRRSRRGSPRCLRAGDVVTVSGELGAGKTTFVRGACRALGVDRPVTSPTYTIGHRYDAPVPVAHLDLYRLAGHRRRGVGRPRALLRWHDCLCRVARARRRLASAGPGGRDAWRTSTNRTASITIDSDDDLRL